MQAIEPNRLGFTSQPCYLLAQFPWKNDVTCLSISLLFFKMETVIVVIVWSYRWWFSAMSVPCRVCIRRIDPHTSLCVATSIVVNLEVGKEPFAASCHLSSGSSRLWSFIFFNLFLLFRLRNSSVISSSSLILSSDPPFCCWTHPTEFFTSFILFYSFNISIWFFTFHLFTKTFFLFTESSCFLSFYFRHVCSFSLKHFYHAFSVLLRSF